MKRHRLAVGVLLVAASYAVSSCAVLDVGLGYERAAIYANQSFSVDEAWSVAFHRSDTHVLEYVVGRGHSRVTTAHGYEDRILIEFKNNPQDPSGQCTVLRGTRTGYRRVGSYGIRSPEDIWVKIRRCRDHYHVEGAVKITLENEEGFDPNRWDVVVIPPHKVKPNQRMQRIDSR